MDDLPTVTGRKRLLSEADDDLLTPRKARAIKSSTTPGSAQRVVFPSTLQPVLSTYTLIIDALIPALASTGAASFVLDSSAPNMLNMPNVLTHGNVLGLTVDNLKRLVYLLEWDPKNPQGKLKTEDDDNPFLVSDVPSTRGGHGLIITQTTHLNFTTRTRSPAYGIGIQLERKQRGKTKDMNSVTRWLEERDIRSAAVEGKLKQWIEYHRKVAKTSESKNGRASSPTPVPIPPVPFADLPALASTQSSPTKRSGLGTGNISINGSPTKSRLVQTVPFQTPFQTPSRPRTSTSSVPFPTPDSTRTLIDTPSTATPSTPRTEGGRTPSTARREALRERIRQKSLQGDATPTRNRVAVTIGTDESGQKQTKYLNQEEMRRRCMLGRLEGIAECITTLFSSNPSGGTIAVRRRIIKADEVIRTIVKSARSPLSDSEATESLDLLLELCPAFLKARIVERERWLEMPTIPAPAATSTGLLAASPNISASPSTSPSKKPPETPRKPKMAPPSSPVSSRKVAPPASPTRSPSAGRRFPASPGGGMTREEVEEELLSRKNDGSPRRPRILSNMLGGAEYMTLGEVRERIRRELEKV